MFSFYSRKASENFKELTNCQTYYDMRRLCALIIAYKIIKIVESKIFNLNEDRQIVIRTEKHNYCGKKPQ